MIAARNRNRPERSRSGAHDAMNLIILTEHDRVGGETFRLAAQRADHLRTVLRATEGDLVQVGLLNGPCGTARVARLAADEALLDCRWTAPPPAPVPTVDLICALPRLQTLKKILFAAAMMGVRRLHLVRARRVERSYFSSPLLNPEQYTPHLIEGLSQGRLTRLPEVAVHDRFRRFFEDILPVLEQNESAPSLRLAPHPGAAAMLDAVYRGDSPRLLAAVGPEGGWVPFEVELLTSLGFRAFSLGRFTLRVEHAVTAVLSQIELLAPR